jgi:hypothetical protein
VYYDFENYLKLSAFLNLQLSATGVGRENILSIILGRRMLPAEDREVLLKILEYLDTAYVRRRRRLGSLAVLHPLRATALLARALPDVNKLDLMTELLHDKFEDLTVDQVGHETFARAEAQLRDLLNRVDPTDQWFLMERLVWLARRQDETYLSYIGRMLDHAEKTRELVWVKLADRLDNTLDTRIEIEDPLRGVDFFESLFKVMFVPEFEGYHPGGPHPARSPVGGVRRLYQLFKNAVLLSMIRQRRSTADDPSAESLFTALATASMKEAQRSVMHIFAYHECDVKKQRSLLVDTMNYVQSGGIDRVTHPNDIRALDGLFVGTFDNMSQAGRDANLRTLAADRPRMLQAALAFIVIFLRFLHDSDYFIAGVSEQGITPKA